MCGLETAIGAGFALEWIVLSCLFLGILAIIRKKKNRESLSLNMPSKSMVS